MQTVCCVCESFHGELFVQYYSDANEVESWLKEKEPLVSSHNYGKDDASAKVGHSYTTVPHTVVYLKPCSKNPLKEVRSMNSIHCESCQGRM